MTEEDALDFWSSKGDVSAVDPADLNVQRAHQRHWVADQDQRCPVEPGQAILGFSLLGASALRADSLPT
jgi:hypothetical protein